MAGTEPRAGARVAVIVGAGAAFFVLARRARRGTVTAREERAFRRINGLPRTLLAPVWVVMQAGSLTAVGVAAVVAGSRSRSTGAGIGVAGTAVWALAKAIKRFVRRGRPSQHLDHVSVRGARQAGLGFPSGHAAVATTLAVVGSRILPDGCRWVSGATAIGVGAAREYVGAHLPLDIAGGVALGVAAGTLTNMVLDGVATR
jgi:membrane-associated phospholipid phosphatase